MRRRCARFAALALLLAFAGLPRLDAQTLAHITVVTSPSDSGAEVYYAQSRGTFKKYGLEVEIISLAGGAAVAAAMSSGKYEIGQGNIATIAAAYEAGLPFVLVAPASLYNSRAATSALVVAKDSPIKTAADLEGKNVANLAVQDIGSVALDRWLEQQGVNPASVHVVEMPQTQMTEALARGRIAAAIMIEPFLSAGLAESTRVLAQLYSAIAPRFMIAAYFARSDWVASHRDAARAFAAAMNETARWANANHALSAQILAQYTKVQLPPNQTRVTYAQTLDPALIQPLIDAAVKSKLLKEPLAASALLGP
jgi:NitT/TauT family transport system substrate-binding protein